MNRRIFVGAAIGALMLPPIRAAAIDIDLIESPLIDLLRHIPDPNGYDGTDFPDTELANNLIRQLVPVENPDIYWDPLAEDYNRLLGFHPNVIRYSARQPEEPHLEAWRLDMDGYAPTTTRKQLIALGWEENAHEPDLLYYTGSDKERASLAETLHLAGNLVTSGAWNYIAFPGDDTIVFGNDGTLVRIAVNRFRNYTAMATIDSRFTGLRYLLPVETYAMRLVPNRVLPVPDTEAAFLAKSWQDEHLLVQSIGLLLTDVDDTEAMITSIETRLQSEVSIQLQLPYKDFLKLREIKVHGRGIRYDFVSNTPGWDILRSLDGGDLGMLPLE